jgi:uncharacterized membrane protein YedE/YeeE
VKATVNTGPLAFICGLIFALGLGIAGMTQPAKVIAFLDVTGDWDPSLALVMAGAIGVHLPLLRWGGKAHAAATYVDRRLVLGAALFGIGWGLSGFCPGPAVVALATGSGGVLLFVAAMLAGMALHRRLLG